MALWLQIVEGVNMSAFAKIVYWIADLFASKEYKKHWRPRMCIACGFYCPGTEEMQKAEWWGQCPICGSETKENQIERYR